MERPTVTAQQLFDACRDRLQLRWLEANNTSITIAPQPVPEHERSLIGHLNFIHPHRIQVLGRSELAYIEELGKNSRNDALARLFSSQCALVILAEDSKLPVAMRNHAQQSDIPLIGSPLSSTRLVNDIGFYLHHLLAEGEVVHGVFMEVLGLGVLLTGKSAIGKSELALELLTRGHRLVADDAPVFVQSSQPGRLNGYCPEVLQNFLEVRGLGVLNIRAMFGEVAVRQNMVLNLIVHLAPVEPEQLEQIDRLHGTRRKRRILHSDIDEVELPVAPGRNLAVLVEAAARNHILYTNGYDSAEDFIRSQNALIQTDTA